MSGLASHPFLTFGLDTNRIDAGTWLALGEAMSKCQHLAGVPLKPAAAAEMASVFLARGIQATAAIEGNTLSDAEVKAIVDDGDEQSHVPESRAYLEQEIRNILAAITEIDHALRNGVRLPITAERLNTLNERVLRDTPQPPEVVAGQVRNHNVTAGRYRAPDWPTVPALVDEFVMWLHDERASVGKGSRREDKFVSAVLCAILSHLYIAWIHPYGNGNGRLARLIEVQILSESGVIPLVATNLLSDHYNKTRDAYYLALDRAQGDVMEFVRYSIRGFLDELREQVKLLRRESLLIHWESHVHETFRHLPSTEARDRQRHLALTLPFNKEVTPEEATLLDTRLAKAYGKTGERTPARDLNELVKLKLVRRAGTRKYVSRRDDMEAFIPPVSS